MKIADFGLATFLPKVGTKKIFQKCGTPNNIAPEIFTGIGYDTKCDIFSIGSVMFNLLTGFYLFNGANNYEILLNNQICDLSLVSFYI